MEPQLDIERTNLGGSLIPLLESRDRKAALSAARFFLTNDPPVLEETARDAVAGTQNGAGYIWVLTHRRILILSKAEQAGSMSADFGEIHGVRKASRWVGGRIEWTILARIRDRMYGMDFVAESSLPELLAEASEQTADAMHVVFTTDGYFALAANHTELDGEYLGGHPVLPKPTKLTVAVDDRGVHMLTSWWYCPLSIAWDDLSELVVEGSEETRRRITATRLFAVGLFALAIPKDEKRNHAYLTAVGKDGQVIVRTALTPHEARAKLGLFTHNLPSPVEDIRSTSRADALADALTRIADLHAQGALDDDEFAAAKRRILGP